MGKARLKVYSGLAQGQDHKWWSLKVRVRTCNEAKSKAYKRSRVKIVIRQKSRKIGGNWEDTLGRAG